MAALTLLFAFDGELRKALLGRSASLTGVGQVSARQFLAVLDGLTRVLLAPDINRTSRINLFNSPLLPNLRNHEPQTWEEQPFHELSPAYRAHVSCAVIALLSDEPVSRQMSGVKPAYERHSLEWLLASTPLWVQAALVRESIRWPAPLRSRPGASSADGSGRRRHSGAVLRVACRAGAALARTNVADRVGAQQAPKHLIGRANLPVR